MLFKLTLLISSTTKYNSRAVIGGWSVAFVMTECNSIDVCSYTKAIYTLTPKSVRASKLMV
jgi:hypothetical protein